MGENLHKPKKSKPIISKQILLMLSLITILNAQTLGWAVRMDKSRIILKKSLKDCSEIDHDTPRLLERLLAV